jgi:hypothetical protein
MTIDAVTAWDLLEHLETDDLSSVLKNVQLHLKDDGIFLFSVATIGDCIQGIELYKTILPLTNCESIFAARGFEPASEIEQYLAGQSDRGRPFDESIGFSIALKKKGGGTRELAPAVGIFKKTADRFIGSKLQKRLKTLITGSQLLRTKRLKNDI